MICLVNVANITMLYVCILDSPWSFDLTTRIPSGWRCVLRFGLYIQSTELISVSTGPDRWQSRLVRFRVSTLLFFIAHFTDTRQCGFSVSVTMISRLMLNLHDAAQGNSSPQSFVGPETLQFRRPEEI
jgi:hypothetical protein